MSAEARIRLATMQSDLVAALSGRAAAPPGFDVARVRAASMGLVNKRRRAVARVWTGLADALADRWITRFEEYATRVPPPQAGGPLADGRAFLRWLAKTGEEPEACRLQMLTVDLHYAATAEGLVACRGPMFKISWLRERLRLLLAVRLPWLRELWFTVPLWRRRV